MPERYFCYGVPMIGDIKKERGPMTGLLSVLIATGEESAFVVACDMPFINADLISLLVSRHSSLEKVRDAVIPVFDGKIQPLFGIYTKNIIKTTEEMIQHGQRSLTEMLTRVNTLYISEEDVKAVDPMGRSFANINTMEEYDKYVI
ncbi:MAG: hypothetical protein OHK0032_05110 [Thermodesulfovibrionales bacterium]